jgi:hypothetical protein
MLPTIYPMAMASSIYFGYPGTNLCIRRTEANVNITRWGTIFSKFRIVLLFVGAIFQDFFIWFICTYIYESQTVCDVTRHKLGGRMETGALRSSAAEQSARYIRSGHIYLTVLVLDSSAVVSHTYTSMIQSYHRTY